MSILSSSNSNSNNDFENSDSLTKIISTNVSETGKEAVTDEKMRGGEWTVESDNRAGKKVQRGENVVMAVIEEADDAYETDEHSAEGVEHMQLNPSTDLYDDDEDEEYEGDDEEIPYQNGNMEPEILPEAKELVQSPNDEKNSAKEDRKHVMMVEEEEDMGYDEDDERIAIASTRQQDERRNNNNANDNDNDNYNDSNSNKGFMNEEGSGSYGRATLNRYKSNVNDNSFRLDYLEKYRRKQQKLLTESASRDEVDSRESSGNFANDDEDDDDDRDDEDDDDTNDDGDAEGGGFFNSKRSKSSSRYFRKNTNDAIKIISTPLGKVGIVYQQTPAQEETEKKDTTVSKKTTSFTDFDALSPDPESSHRLASSHPKITPVLTPDGKVALLYRGDSESSKYEPIRNLTHKFNNNKNDATDNKSSATRTNNKDIVPDSVDSDHSDDESTDESDGDDDDENDGTTNINGEQTNVRGDNINAKVSEGELEGGVQYAGVGVADTTGSFIIRPTDSVLPMINRPLSEVLGIKKNQFKQFRIKDSPTHSPTTETVLRSLAGVSVDHATDTAALHILTKVNLAEYPTSARTRNLDFDFSRDNTMLDERTRHRNQHYQQSSESSTKDHNEYNNNPNYNDATEQNKANTIANDEVLAKTEVVNLAIIPHFDEELERLQRLREHESRRHHRQRHRQKPSEEDLSGIHCIMQAMMGIAAISTVFGMLGTFFKQRILDQIRLMHW